MRRLAFVIVAAAALAVGAGHAAAVDLPANQSQFSSAQLLDGKFLWFQRNDRAKKATKKDPYGYTPGVGAIYSRQLTAKKAQRVYLPPKGSRIVAFKAAAGRVVVGLAPRAERGRGPSSIVELTPGVATPWTTATLATAADTIDAQSCGSRVELIGVQSDADALIQKSSLEARGKDCVLSRQVSELTSYPKLGPTVTLGTRTSGWSAKPRWNLLPALFPANGDWLPSFVGTYDDMSAPSSTWNPIANSKKLFPTDNEISRSEPTADGGILARGWGADATLYPNLADPSKVIRLKRDKATSWFRACGNSIIEITRKRSAKRSGKWSILIRNSSGKTERRLAKKLNAGTMFGACDQNTAMFHRWRYNGGVRQWSVSLAG